MLAVAEIVEELIVQVHKTYEHSTKQLNGLGDQFLLKVFWPQFFLVERKAHALARIVESQGLCLCACLLLGGERRASDANVQGLKAKTETMWFLLFVAPLTTDRVRSILNTVGLDYASILGQVAGTCNREVAETVTVWS